MSEAADRREDLQEGQGRSAVDAAAAAAGDPVLAHRIRRLETPGAFTIMTVYLGLFVLAWLLSFVYLGVRWVIE